MTTDELHASLSNTQAAALTAWGEARNQPVIGIVAVLAVIWNRVRSGRWGHTVAAVCFAPRQFSCWNELDPNRNKLEALAGDLLAGRPIDDPVLRVCLFLAALVVGEGLRDPTGGATHYFAPAVVAMPSWAKPPAVRTAIIDGHAFYNNVR